MIRINSVEENPFHSIVYRTSGRKGSILTQSLNFHRASTPNALDGIGSIVLTSDLQGREQGGKNRLLGEVVAEELNLLADLGEIAPVGLVVLAGDLYEYPGCHKRGGTGEVGQVWNAFALVSPCVVGVCGNHDLLGPAAKLSDHITVLDGDLASARRLTIGGVSGIIGDPGRAERKTEDSFLNLVDRVTRRRPDLLVLHQGPDDPARGRRGHPMVRLALEKSYQGLTVFGHCHWEAPFLIDVGEGQAINVDGRVIILSAGCT